MKSPEVQKAAQNVQAKFGAVKPMSMTALKKEIDKYEREYSKLFNDYRRAVESNKTKDIIRLKKLIQANLAQISKLKSALLKTHGGPAVSGRLIVAEPTTTHGGPATTKAKKTRFKHPSRYSVRN